MTKSRSALMSRIRGKNTDPELVLRKALWKRGLRYRVHARTPVGRPDVVFPKQKLAIFIDGCFWHGCPEHYVRPRTRTDFWSNKLRENVERDARQLAELEACGWQAVRIWEHDVHENLSTVVETIARALDGTVAERTSAWRVVLVEPLHEKGTHERRHHRDIGGLRADRVVEQARHTRKWKLSRRAEIAAGLSVVRVQ